MAIHTFICSAGRRLNIRPSKTSPGLVEISILNADRDLVASCTMCASSADVASKALAMEALAAEAGIHGFKVEVRPTHVVDIEKRFTCQVDALEVSHGNL